MGCKTNQSICSRSDKGQAETHVFWTYDENRVGKTAILPRRGKRTNKQINKSKQRPSLKMVKEQDPGELQLSSTGIK